MKIWLVYREEDCLKNEWYIKQYIIEGETLGIEVSLVLTKDLILGIDKTCYVQWVGHENEIPDAAIIRTIDPKLSYHFEMAGIRTFNRATISRMCNDKAITYQKVSQLGVNSIPTLICKRELLQQTMNKVKLPVVIKTVDGHGGQEVFLVRSNTDETINNIQNSTTSDFVIQPLVGKKHQDLRVYVLGKQILCCILRTSQGEFKANYSLGGTVCSYELTKENHRTVMTIVQAFDFDLVGIDFIIGDDNSLIFNEIEDVVGARMLYQCTNINLVAIYLHYVKENIEKSYK